MGSLAPQVMVFIPQTSVFTIPLQSATDMYVDAAEPVTLAPAKIEQREEIISQLPLHMMLT